MPDEELATPAAGEAHVPIGRPTLSPGRFDGRRSGARVVELATRLPLLRTLVGQSSIRTRTPLVMSGLQQLSESRNRPPPGIDRYSKMTIARRTHSIMSAKFQR